MNNVAIIDDVLDKETFETVLKLCKEQLPNYKEIGSRDITPFRSYNSRWYPPKGSYVAKIAEDMLWGEKVKETALYFPDLAWKWFIDDIVGGFEVQVTQYKPGDSYKWHTDHMAHLRILNYILYLEEPEEGGELQISSWLDSYRGTDYDYPVDDIIQPKANRLAVMPSWMVHRVMPVTKGNRITLNGHVKINF